MTSPSSEHLAHALWPHRRKFRWLHATDYADEMALLTAVRKDIAGKFYTNITTALDFYRDLNLASAETK
jgi:hypothetical protein